MTDRGCNWSGGNNMPGACQVRRVLPARFLQAGTRDTALATARLIASSHSNIIAVFHYRSDHNHSQTFSRTSMDPELATTEMARCVISSVSRLPRTRRQLLTRWRADTSGPWMGNSHSRTKAGRACRSSRHAVRPISTRSTSTCSFGPSRTEGTEKPSPACPLAFHPQKTPFPPPTPNDVSLERPRNASC